MDNCVVCLESNVESFSRITSLSSEWVKENIRQTIEKHLWWWYTEPPSFNNDFVQWICRQCWLEISTFHKFYCKVEIAHRHYPPTTVFLQQPNYAKNDIEVKTESITTDLLLPNEQCKARSREQHVTKEHFDYNDIDVVKVKKEFIDMEETKSEYCFNTNEGNAEQKDNNGSEAICFDVLFLPDFEDCNYKTNYLENHSNKSLTSDVIKIKCQKTTKRKTVSKHSEQNLHIKLKHNNPVHIKESSVNYSKGKSFRCDICGMKFFNTIRLNLHMENMHNEEQQMCPYCSKISPHIRAHRQHIHYAHTMERKHACHMCEKKFRRPVELKEHLSTHTGEPLYSCHYCPRTFISSGNMSKHRRADHAKEWSEDKLKKDAVKKLRQPKISLPGREIIKYYDSPNVAVSDMGSSEDNSLLIELKVPN